jgi:alcohol dehydrogenase
MQACQLDKLGGTLSLNNVPIPELRAGTVLVKMEAAALMSYQKDYVEGKLPVYNAPKKTFTLGGNGIGTVEAVGKDVWHLKAGQRVIISSHLTAGENVPEPAQMLLGVTAVGTIAEAIQADWADGTYAEYALLPKEIVTPIDDLPNKSSEQLIVSAMRYSVPYSGLLRGRLSAGETIIINGATGAYGYAAVQLALAMGAGRIIAAGRNKDKLKTVSRLNNDRIVCVELTEDSQTDIRHLREAAKGGAHIAFDMVGNATNPTSTLAALRSLQCNGRLVLMGSMSSLLPVSYGEIMFNNLEILGQFMYPQDIYLRLFRLIRSGLLNNSIKPVVFPLHEFEAAMEAATSADNTECVILKM